MFLVADPVNEEGEVEEEPGGLVPAGIMGEPVADVPEPILGLPDGAAIPVEATPPVALMNPEEPMALVELSKVLANFQVSIGT